MFRSLFLCARLSFMPSSQSDWDAKHSLATNAAAEAPAGILTGLWPLLPAGAALDLACGRGRNALFLAEHGRHVSAVDWSGVALDILEDRAKALQIPVRRISQIGEAKLRTRVGIDLLQTDLQALALPAD